MIIDVASLNASKLAMSGFTHIAQYIPRNPLGGTIEIRNTDQSIYGDQRKVFKPSNCLVNKSVTMEIAGRERSLRLAVTPMPL